MKDLKCGLKDCRFNKGYSCCANCITITAETDCRSYQPLEQNRRSLFEAGEEFAKAVYTVDTKVACKAPCVFNKGEVCHANGITVMTDNLSPASCLTFIKE